MPPAVQGLLPLTLREQKAMKMAIPAIIPAIKRAINLRPFLWLIVHEMLGHYSHYLTNRLKDQVSS